MEGCFFIVFFLLDNEEGERIPAQRVREKKIAGREDLAASEPAKILLAFRLGCFLVCTMTSWQPDLYDTRERIGIESFRLCHWFRSGHFLHLRDA